jgi:hypothetical protein
LPDVNWGQIAVGVATGGAAGAIITAAVTSIKNRKQPVGYRIDIVPVFKHGKLADSQIIATLNLSSPTAGYGTNIPNLFIADIRLENRGNRDLVALELGLTLSETDSAVYCSINSIDRHHVGTIKNPVGPGSPSREIDIRLVPFNRQDIYNLTLYLVTDPTSDEPGEIGFSSTEPVVFTRKPSVAELAAEVATGLAFRLGPIHVSLPKLK